MSDMIPEGSAPIEMPATNPASPAPASAPEVAPQPEISPAAQQYQREREMFSKGAEATGTPLPGNFNSFEDYFDSLKSAQGQFTEARQELSELRAKMAMEADLTPAEAEAAEEAAAIEGYEDLEIPEPEAEEVEEELGEDEYLVGMTEDEADAWSEEYFETGTFTEETMSSILDSFPGVTEEMIDIYFTGLQAMESRTVETAVSAAGSQENLQELFNWASNNLSPAERAAANEALEGPLASQVISGLMAQMQASAGQRPRAGEPQPSDNRVAPSTAGATDQISGFSSPMEMNQALNDPRYNSDPAFTQAVAVALSRTTWITGG